MQPLGNREFKVPELLFPFDYLTSNWCCYFYSPLSLFVWNRANALTLYIKYTSESMFKNTHMNERTRQLQTIIFLSHHEAVKCSAEERNSVCAFSPTLFSFSLFYPDNKHFDLFQHPVHLNGKKWTPAALSPILWVQVSVAVISQMVSLLTVNFQEKPNLSNVPHLQMHY